MRRPNKKKSKIPINNEYLIILAIDEEYPQFMFPAMESILDNIDFKRKCKIYVFYTKNSEKEVDQLIAYTRPHVIIEKLSINDRIRVKVEDNLLILKDNVFSKYDKALYLDSKCIVMEDLSPLWQIDFKRNLLLAPEDVIPLCTAREAISFRKIHKTLPFNDRVMMVNLNILRRTPNISIEVFGTLDYRWGFICHHNELTNVRDVIRKELPVGRLLEWEAAAKQPGIIHYDYIPWDYVGGDYAIDFWKYARRAPQYRELLFTMQRNLINWMAN